MKENFYPNHILDVEGEIQHHSDHTMSVLVIGNVFHSLLSTHCQNNPLNNDTKKHK